MKKLWLLFSQVVTVLLACLFVLFVLFASGKEEMAMPTPPPDTLRSAAKAAAPAVVSLLSTPSSLQHLPKPVTAKPRRGLWVKMMKTKICFLIWAAG